MKAYDLHAYFSKSFDVVGIIKTKRYMEEAKKMNRDIPLETYPTLVVLGLAYPYRRLISTKTHLVPSFYTFGSDYHQVLKKRILDVMQTLGVTYHMGVDNHPHDERLAAVLSGVGFFGKNQLIINQNFGSYLFLGMVFIDLELEHEIILEVSDDCGTCTKCIDSCPTRALEENTYHMERCMSFFNQEKKVLTDKEIQANYSLFGCDICQMVCPKNIKKGEKVHPEFELSGKEMVSIADLFSMSEREFKHKYHEMSYLWKGKTILMRNAATLLLRQKNHSYNDLLESSLKKHDMPWYQVTVSHIINQLKK
ncbi:MAG: 4Fe-4S double cluster binding domain-containing protein [Acholeplasmataceae bacterium]|jgi:epoxyqueuosine reductase|nr:4Fe-4S double cluster binding domain-containing protein [Acholeplasmataceae bacterium]